MSERMTEIRSPLRGRGVRHEPSAADSVDPLDEMSVQIRALDAAAERTAARIAEAAAGLENEHRREDSAIRADLLAGLASALVDRTEGIRTDCARLSALIDRTARLIAERDSTAAQVPPPESRPPSLGGREDGFAGTTSEGVRLIATQMAIAGSSRSEIERRLRTEFGINDAARALDEIFGTQRGGVG